jgi:NMD protein affecting ribosome stability and mRNA decay
MTDSCLVCPSCGYLVDQLHEGYCRDCLQHRHDAHLLDVHQRERWARMSPAERDREISDAVRRAR